MKLSQVRTVENIHLAGDLTKSIVAANRPGLTMETYENVGIVIKYKGLTGIVPWGNIVVAISGDVPDQSYPIKHKADTSAKNS